MPFPRQNPCRIQDVMGLFQQQFLIGSHTAIPSLRTLRRNGLCSRRSLETKAQEITRSLARESSATIFAGGPPARETSARANCCTGGVETMRRRPAARPRPMV